MIPSADHGPAHATESLARTIRRVTGLNPACCYQCGKCSAGCPMAEESLRPHDVMRMVNQGEVDRLLEGPAIWLCLTCETCTSRCPNGCDPARVMDALRELAIQRDPTTAPKPIRAFHRAFLNQIKASGRIHEFGLVAAFKMTGGPLFQDVASAPGMVARGKLPLVPHRIAGVADVRRIFERCSDPEETR